ncbi:hypothetical protein POM88_033824 [Heracleum sosnowskyi]|uniref:Uncharacterized protein n=1 Tax=Heracleum sosnowskyi TaxID=360622 RepID=A0AAD8HI45_9APIA|nr:hypothetical protein POM88_033824 [Heracleum sosnowskyi]
MDVLNITYYGAESTFPEKQLGTIKVNSTDGFQYLCKVEEVDMSKMPIGNGDPILLTSLAPTIAFDHFDDVVILEFDLFCGAFKGSVCFDTRIADGEAFSMQEQLISTDNLNMILVQMGHYANATTATVEVHMSGNPIATNVYGAVFATNSRLDTPNCASVLFLDDSREGLKVGPNGKIPLSRSCVGVPLDSDFWNANEDIVLQTYETSDPNKAKERGEPKATDDKEAVGFSRLTARLGVNSTVLSTKRMIILFSSEGAKFEVEEEVALGSGSTLLKGRIEAMAGDEHAWLHTGITKSILSEVINYCKYLAHPFSSQIAFDDGYLRQLSPVMLFNLIECLLNILVGIDSCKEDKDMFNIQMYSVRILSHNSNQQDFSKVVVQAFVKLMSNPSNVLKSMAVMALTRLALDSEDRVLNILQEGALEKALGIVKELNLLFVEDSELMHWIALFMAVVCTFIPSFKVKVFLTISEEIFQKHSLDDHRHIVPTCFALQCLVERPCAIEEEELRKLTSRLSVLILNCLEVEFRPTAVISSILGIVHNIALWGNGRQLQVRSSDKSYGCSRINRSFVCLLQSSAGCDSVVKVEAARLLHSVAPCYDVV